MQAEQPRNDCMIMIYEKQSPLNGRDLYLTESGYSALRLPEEGYWKSNRGT